MTTIIERPSGDGDSGGNAVLGVIVGALAALVIGMIMFSGAFDRQAADTTDTKVTVETPAPAPAPTQP